MQRPLEELTGPLDPADMSIAEVIHYTSNDRLHAFVRCLGAAVSTRRTPAGRLFQFSDDSQILFTWEKYHD